MEQFVDAPEQFANVAAVPVAVGKFHIFLAEVQFELHQGRVFDEGITEALDFPAEPATELLQGQAMGPGMVGVDEVSDGLGLGQVALAVEERALGEFTRKGRPAAGRSAAP